MIQSTSIDGAHDPSMTARGKKYVLEFEGSKLPNGQPLPHGRLGPETNHPLLP